MCVCTFFVVCHDGASSIDQRKDSAQKQTQKHWPLHSQQTQANKPIASNVKLSIVLPEAAELQLIQNNV